MNGKKDFIPIFIQEVRDHLDKLNQGLVGLEKKPFDLELIKELNRAAHTIKGSAHVFGYLEIKEIAHRMESLLERVARKKQPLDSPLADVMFASLDAVGGLIDRIEAGMPLDMDVSAVIASLDESLDVRTGGRKMPSEKSIPSKNEAHLHGKETESTKQPSGDMSPQRNDKPEEYIKVPLSRVNKLLNLIGELVINKMKSSRKVVNMRNLDNSVKRLQKQFSHLAENVKNKIDCQDEDIHMAYSQCAADIDRLREASLCLYDGVTVETSRLDPIIEELQSRMKEIRMLPIDTIFQGFPRMVRDIAARQGKDVNLEIKGEETELDKKVLEGIKTSLMHILRNSIDHGIEDPGERPPLGKSRIGTLRLSAYHEAGNVVVEVEDDGRGIDIGEIREKVREKKMVSNEDLVEMSDREVLDLIFMNGYTTSPLITDISGRGIGLDIVKRDITRLKGQVELETEKGAGTRFKLILPLTIAIVQVLLIKTSGELFGIPMTAVEETLRIEPRNISTLEGRMAAEIRETIVPLLPLADILDLSHPLSPENSGEDADSHVPIVLTASSGRRIGFIVDDIIGEEEIFIKGLGEHLGKVKNVSGAAILGSGNIAIVLDVPDLIASGIQWRARPSATPVELGRQSEKKRILVVEDAFSTRELEKSILESRGYAVDTAVDGLDALSKIALAHYSLVISDVNMPRMGGFELCRTLKANEEYQNIPVVIVTSLEKETDKRRGIEVGASAYIVKTAFDQFNLLDTVERLIG